MNWYLGVLRKYAVFSGRARRKEYWMFVLFNTIIVFILTLVEGVAGIGSQINPNELATLYMFAVLLPSLAVGFRRLHDTGRSGWWSLIGFVPIIGTIVFMVFMVQNSQRDENPYGPNPKIPVAG